MSETLTIDFSEPVPLFPLPNCVLLPHATIPLHIFEPRYRRMVADALKGRKLIAMASFAGESWKQNYEGTPPLRENVCLGYVVRDEKMPDGRYNILLQGVCRARIADEVESTPYRMAMLEPIEPQPPLMEIDLADHRQRIEGLLTDPYLKQLTTVNAIHNWLSPDVPTLALIDLAVMTLSESSEQRYDLLGEPDASKRADWLERLMRDTRRSLIMAERFQPAEQPDGVFLN